MREIDPSEVLLQAFYDGDANAAYAAAHDLSAAYREALLEASQQRFRVNFGTDRCTNCTGLHAGPDVVATCYQMQRCDYSNFRAEQTDAKKQRIVGNLLRNKR